MFEAGVFKKAEDGFSCCLLHRKIVVRIGPFLERLLMTLLADLIV